jgi:C-terminal processing protease CtpA/Prc
MLFLSLVLSLVLAQEEDRFQLLKDTRKDWTFIPYSAEQKVQVAQTMYNMFSIYVNRESKISFYGKEKPDIDPIPRAKKILDNAASMTDREFHYSFAEVVASLRDRHTSYTMPGAHSCHFAIRVPFFTVVEDGGFCGIGMKEKIVVNRLMNIPEIAALTPESSQLNIGDELLAVDGVPIQEFIKSKLFSWGGANESGGLRGVLTRLSFVEGSSDPLPEKNENIFKMKSLKTREEYNVPVSWVVLPDSTCIQAVKELEEQIKNGSVPESFAQPIVQKYKPGRDVYKLRQKMFGRMDQFAKVTVNPTSDSEITWAVYEPENRNLGIIYLTSFNPDGFDSVRAIMMIRDLLLNQLKDTNAILFDVRENGGGIATMADMIPQLFGSDIETFSIRALVAPINGDIFLNSTFFPSDDEFSVAYRQAKAGDKYSPLVKETSYEIANSIGQAYLKPVGVFTSGNCYSSCDIFAANMQDNDVATIYGEDKFTGAG